MWVLLLCCLSVPGIIRICTCLLLAFPGLHGASKWCISKVINGLPMDSQNAVEAIRCAPAIMELYAGPSLCILLLWLLHKTGEPHCYA